MKLFSPIAFLFFFTTAAIATDIEQAKPWLEKLSSSLKQLNYSTSFVVVKNNQAEPYHWLHGLNAQAEELEILARLNGPRRDVLRKNSVVSYIEPEQEAYSVSSEFISGPIPDVFRRNIDELEVSYRFISVGRSRVLGRVAQVIRIVPKDNHRFDYWVWLEQQSGLLLKMAIITRQGQLLEQVQFTHLDVTDEMSENLKQLENTELPNVINEVVPQAQQALFWHVHWLPQGFQEIKSNRRRVYNNKTVEFMLFSDGLVDVSVYVNPSAKKQRPIEYASDGATLVFSQITNGLEVSVVGKIPLPTAKKIADSISPAIINN